MLGCACNDHTLVVLRGWKLILVVKGEFDFRFHFLFSVLNSLFFVLRDYFLIIENVFDLSF